METTGIETFLVWLARTSLEAGILVVLVWAVQWLFRRRLTPRWRCALWLLVAARLVLPCSFSSETSIFNLLPSAARIPPSHPEHAISAALAILGSQVPTPARLAPNQVKKNLLPTPPGENQIPEARAPSLSTSRSPRWSWPLLIFILWLAGVLVLVGHVVVSHLRLQRRCAPLPPARRWTATLLRECCARMQLSHPPALLESSALGSPALHGFFRPRLLLPPGFTAKFSPTELRFVFLHELAHLRRRDLLANWLVVVLQILHWFNPLLWAGFARWRAERELACDAMALEAAGEGQNKEYGRTILRLLEGMARPTAAPSLVGMFEDRRQLRRRIRMIASFVPTPGWPRLAIVLIGLLAAMGLTDAQTATSTTTAPPKKGNEMNTSMITNQIVRAATVGLLALASPTTPAALAAEDNSTAPKSSELGNQLIGAWVLIGTPDHVGNAPTAGGRIKFFTGTHWCITQAEPKTGVVLFHHGGTYTVNGNAYSENLEFADSSTVDMMGGTNGHFIIKIEGNTMTNIGVDNPWKEVWQRLKSQASASGPGAADLAGTWAYAGQPGATNEATPNLNQLKFCAGGYWCDSYIDPKTHVVTVHHGGVYSLKDGQYVETCQYANPSSMNLIGHDANFNIETQGDTLTLKGINNPWNEVWKRQ